MRTLGEDVTAEESTPLRRFLQYVAFAVAPLLLTVWFGHVLGVTVALWVARGVVPGVLNFTTLLLQFTMLATVVVDRMTDFMVAPGRSKLTYWVGIGLLVLGIAASVLRIILNMQVPGLVSLLRIP